LETREHRGENKGKARGGRAEEKQKTAENLRDISIGPTRAYWVET